MTITSDYYLELNTIPLDTFAWRCLSYDDILNGPAVRGDDLVMPTAIGQRPYPRRIDRSVVALSMLVIGQYDEDGAEQADPFATMFEHRDYLRANLGLGLESGDGTVPATFYRGSLDPLEGDVTVLAMAEWQVLGRGDATFRLDLSIPDGELAVAGS